MQFVLSINTLLVEALIIDTILEEDSTFVIVRSDLLTNAISSTVTATGRSSSVDAENNNENIVMSIC